MEGGRDPVKQTHTQDEDLYISGNCNFDAGGHQSF